MRQRSAAFLLIEGDADSRERVSERKACLRPSDPSRPGGSRSSASSPLFLHLRRAEHGTEGHSKGNADSDPDSDVTQSYTEPGADTGAERGSSTRIETRFPLALRFLVWIHTQIPSQAPRTIGR